MNSINKITIVIKKNPPYLKGDPFKMETYIGKCKYVFEGGSTGVAPIHKARLIFYLISAMNFKIHRKIKICRLVLNRKNSNIVLR